MKKVTIVGAGKYGSMTALRVAEYDLVDSVVMTDIVEGLPQGLALDMNQSRYVEDFSSKIIGTNDYKDTADSDVVTNPLDQMTMLVSQVSGLPKNKVIGQAGVLDTSRFAYFISEKLNVNMNEIEALTLGSHGETMVPVPSQCRVAGKPLNDLLSDDEISELVQKTSDGGAEIVGLLKTGSAYFAPSSAAAIMVKSILSDSNEIMPACSWVNGEYGINDVFLGVPTMLGSSGVTKVVEIELKSNELNALKSASEAVKSKVDELNSILSQ
jgi:malate dehydrogenase